MLLPVAVAVLNFLNLYQGFIFVKNTSVIHAKCKLCSKHVNVIEETNGSLGRAFDGVTGFIKIGTKVLLKPILQKHLGSEVHGHAYEKEYKPRK